MADRWRCTRIEHQDQIAGGQQKGRPGRWKAPKESKRIEQCFHFNMNSTSLFIYKYIWLIWPQKLEENLDPKFLRLLLSSSFEASCGRISMSAVCRQKMGDRPILHKRRSRSFQMVGRQTKFSEGKSVSKFFGDSSQLWIIDDNRKSPANLLVLVSFPKTSQNQKPGYHPYHGYHPYDNSQ